MLLTNDSFRCNLIEFDDDSMHVSSRINGKGKVLTEMIVEKIYGTFSGETVYM